MAGRQRQPPIALRPRLVPVSAQLREQGINVQAITQQPSVAKTFRHREGFVHLLVCVVDPSSVH